MDEPDKIMIRKCERSLNPEMDRTKAVNENDRSVWFEAVLFCAVTLPFAHQYLKNFAKSALRIFNVMFSEFYTSFFI